MVGVRTWVVAAALPWLACSSSPNGPATDAARDAERAESPAGDGAGDAEAGGTDASGPYDPDGPYAACNDPESQTATLQATGFEAWEGLALLGCLHPAQPVADASCDDGEVTAGAFTISVSVCTGAAWEVHIFDSSRGLDCNTTRAPVDRVFTLTPADCSCASPGRLPSTGCGADLDGGADGDTGASADADDAAPGDS